MNKLIKYSNEFLVIIGTSFIVISILYTFYNILKFILG